MTKPIYNVQCLNGHVYMALPGSELEARCKEHEARGFLDALILHPSECESCKDETSRRDEMTADLNPDFDGQDMVQPYPDKCDKQ